MPHTVVIADDITGANDIGIMYAKAGMSVIVYSYEAGGQTDYESCDVLVIDTDSRFDSYQDAYNKVWQALETAPENGVKQYISKQCSVFRGNIGAEFDAMMDALGEGFAPVVLGFPDNGRTTLHSRHFVHGTQLAQSQFKHDPVHPMHESDLRNILQAQTERKVGAIHYEVYDQGIDAVCSQLAELKKAFNYCIMDVRDNGDLKLLAEVLKNERIICGSSALSAWLAPWYQNDADQVNPEAEPKSKHKLVPDKDQEKILCVAGSLTPQTVKQTGYMKQKGYPVFELDTRQIIDTKQREIECQRIKAAVAAAFKKEQLVMIHTMNTPEMVAETKELAGRYHMENTDISSLVSSVIARLAQDIMTEMNADKIIICGGDTSAAVCQQLGINGLRVLEEIEAGLPTCQSVHPPYYQMVLKSGSFGSEAFIEKAAEVLMRYMRGE